MRRPLYIALFAMGTVAIALPACGKSSDEAQAAPAAEPAAPASVKRIDITVTDAGFSPSSIQAKKGEQVVLRFTRTTTSECLKAIEIPDLKVKKDLPVNTPVEVAITPEKDTGLQCWMGMFKANIHVVGS